MFVTERESRPVTDALIRNVLDTRFDQLPSGVVRRAKLRLLDILGCAVAGSRAAGSAELRALIVARGGRPDATIVPTGERVPAPAAAFVNAISARGYDFGVLIPYIGNSPVWSHISESTVPAALAAAEAAAASGRELLTSLIVGDDLAARLTAASRYQPGAGWDNPGLANKFAVTAIAGRLAGLDSQTLRDALGIVLNQLGGTFQAIDAGAHAFRLAQGLAARDGIEAVELASLGWTGSEDPFFGRNGYVDMYCDGFDLDVVAEDLGSAYHGDATFKPYPGCRFTHSAIDCALELARRLPDDADAIRAITLDVAAMHVDSPLDRPFSPGRHPLGRALFSLRYAAASALLRGEAGLATYTDEAIADHAVAALADRITITGGRPSATPEAARLVVELADGAVLSASREAATGNPITFPLDGAAIEAKFRANCEHSGAIEAGEADRVIDLVSRLEEQTDLADLIATITPRSAVRT